MDREVAVANLCRQVAGAWLQAMSYRGVDFAFLAEKTGHSEEHYRSILHDLIDGKHDKFSLGLFAEAMFALDMQINFELRPRVRHQLEERSDTATAANADVSLTQKGNSND